MSKINAERAITRAGFLRLMLGGVIATTAQGNTTMQPDQIRKRFLSFRSRLYGEHDLSAVDEYVHPEFSSHSPLIPGKGIEAYKDFVRTLYAGVPDLRPIDQHVLVEGNALMAMASWEATHAGTFLGVPATGKTLSLATADRYELRDGLLFKHWDIVDRLSASLAMGLIQSAR